MSPAVDVALSVGGVVQMFLSMEVWCTHSDCDVLASEFRGLNAQRVIRGTAWKI